jgi:predicted RNA-binding Zn-ribbon protein involved in translation (DUF1610 family)
MAITEFLGILQLILLTIIFAATLMIGIMVWEIYMASKTSKVKKSKKELAKLPAVEGIKCPKCGTIMKLTYEGTIVDGYTCPKCGYTEVTSKKEKPKEESQV